MSDGHLRIAQVAPPFERVPPRGYGGTERVVHGLVEELHARGHEVTTFASADSDVPGRLVPTVGEPLRPAGYRGDPVPYFVQTMLKVAAEADRFDLVHTHLEWSSLLLAKTLPVPVVSTFHGRLDHPWAPDLFEWDVPGLVAISESQASAHPGVRWAGIVHNGLDFPRAPIDPRRSDDLCFVGRVAPEKGIIEAIEIAKETGRHLRIAAKVGPLPEEQSYFSDVFRPALDQADAEFLGELDGDERDELFMTSHATLMPGAWPEPFGLVAIESLAAGTPILARRVGALPEIIREGVDGYFGDDVRHLAFLVDRVEGLDRGAIASSVRERFSSSRMTDGYLEVYRRVTEAAGETRTPVSGDRAKVAVRRLPAAIAVGGRPAIVSSARLRERVAATLSSEPREDGKPDAGGADAGTPSDGAVAGAVG